MFFTPELVQRLCDFTNRNAHLVGPSKPSMYAGWVDLDVDGFFRFIALLMYMGVVQVPNIERYWSTTSIYHGLWARSFMTKHRYKQIMCFFKTCDPEGKENVSPEMKLGKVNLLINIIRMRCSKLYQPGPNLSIDERMVANKGRYSFRQYIRDKPTKWGMKLWVLADPRNGYTYDFDAYLGKSVRSSPFGLAYDVVMKFARKLAHRGYRLFFDNFYTGVQLLKEGFIGYR